MRKIIWKDIKLVKMKILFAIITHAISARVTIQAVAINRMLFSIPRYYSEIQYKLEAAYYNRLEKFTMLKC